MQSGLLLRVILSSRFDECIPLTQQTSLPPSSMLSLAVPSIFGQCHTYNQHDETSASDNNVTQLPGGGQERECQTASHQCCGCLLPALSPYNNLALALHFSCCAYSPRFCSCISAKHNKHLGRAKSSHNFHRPSKQRSRFQHTAQAYIQLHQKTLSPPALSDAVQAHHQP